MLRKLKSMMTNNLEHLTVGEPGVPASGTGTAAESSVGQAPGSGWPDAGSGFSFLVSDVFFIRGRGLVAAGQIQSGSITKGDQLVLDGPAGQVFICKDIEVSRRTTDQASAGTSAGLLLPEAKRGDVSPGDILRRLPEV
ncbi:MAG TPA: hypothetical protein VG435_01325 [Acidimicrobiales bacterium]|jgi:elongation factor Tu|nr:hypothetical protein [Acidimicrobiales bacterium]